MLRILSISSFRQVPVALLLAMLCIGLVEWYGASEFPGKFFNHEVDLVLQRVDTRTYNSKYLLLGDSVGLQIGKQLKKTGLFKVLATNQSVEITGYYFLAKRYIKRNKKPEMIVLASLPFLYRNLEQVYTENFVYRTFTNYDEIWSIFKAKRDPATVARMLFYKYFPTYKYRLKLQETLGGGTNANIYSGVDNVGNPAKTGDYSILEVLQDKISTKTTAEIHMDEFLRYLDDLNIKLYYLPVPLNSKKLEDKRSDYYILLRDVEHNFPAIKREHPNFNYDSNVTVHDKHLFIDGAHYNEEGLPSGEKYLKEKVEALIIGNFNHL